MIAIVLNLPAVYLGDVLHIVAILIHFPLRPGEPTLLAFSTLFVPVIWYRVGRWMDDLAMGGIVGGSTQFNAKAVWTGMTRAIAWFLFAILLLGLLVEFHRESNATKFLVVTAILWTGVYLAGGFLGDRRRKSQLRASAGG